MYRYVITIVVMLVCCDTSLALQIRNHYSPRNRERPKRKLTRFIILHTTEGPTVGSLKKVTKNGEAHYLVDPTGKAYRIIDRSRVAYHAGRSMWNGNANLDDSSIGIEVVGYHNQEPLSRQLEAVSELLDKVQSIYKIPDDRVLTHSMVAYGAPNRWHRRSHRGRKRCGMVFARRSTRAKINLARQPNFDPDVQAGRLAVGDPGLEQALYDGREKPPVASPNGIQVITAQQSAWDIARDRYDDNDTLYIFPDGTERRGNEIKNWKRIPLGTQMRMVIPKRENPLEHVRQIGIGGMTASDIAGDEYNDTRTIYIFPDGRVRTGKEMTDSDFRQLPMGTRVLVGYVQGGRISNKRSAFDVCGVKWNHPSTYYRYSKNELRPGDQVNENNIPKGTQVFFRN